MFVAPDDFKRGMRRLASGVTVITTGRPGGRGGLTATAAMSLTVEPPQLVVAVNHATRALPLLLANRCFAVNVLSDADRALAETFAGRTGKEGEARFEGADWTEMETGSPVLPSAIASFDCRLVQQIPVATHSLLVGQVMAVRIDPTAAPLLHYDGSWASLIPAAEIPAG